MNNILPREQIKKEDTWDLGAMIQDEEEFYKLSNQVESLISSICLMKDHILDDAMSLKKYLIQQEKYSRLLSKVYVYANMNCDTDTTDPKKQTLKMKAEKLLEEANEKLAFTTPEILKGDLDAILTFLEQENMTSYRHSMEEIFRFKPHILTEREEEIISLAQNTFGTGEDAFYQLDNADAKFGMVEDDDGNLVELTTSNYAKLLLSKKQDVRRKVFETYYAYFKDHKNTFAATLNGNIKENFFSSRIRGYKDPLDQSLFQDRIDRSVYDHLIKGVHDHLPSLYEYMEVRKQLLGVDELHMYDMYCDLIEKKAKEIPFEEGKKMVFEALRPLGDAYLADLEKAFQEKWIDKYPNIGKKSGAYKWGCYDSYPYVLLNYDNTFDSVSTMAHELGHAMHSYYSNQKQDYINHDYPIFLAEIASTVNEVLLDDYMYRHAKTKDEKILFLTNFLDKVRTTIYRQTMFAEFELMMHEKEGKGIPLTEEEFGRTYYELNQLYYGDKVVSDDLIRYEWSRIPHFYSSFYVYQYATGLTSALSITNDILNGKENAKTNYLTFLSSGCTDYPLSILKRAGVDMTTDEPLKKALQMFDDKLKELKEVINEK